MWRSHGFGVHSPFAYRFIREVISQPCHYYSYPLIDALAHKAGADKRLFRALFRVAVNTLPAGIEVRGDVTEEVNEVLLLAGKVSSKKTKAIVGLYGNAFLVDEEWGRAERGMLFRDKKMAVFVVSDNLPHQRFDIIIH